MKLQRIQKELLYRLTRIESKCDIIISQISLLRRSINEQNEFDNLIDHLHKAARRMKKQCDNERHIIRRMLNQPPV